MGITILIKIRTVQQNESKEALTLTDSPANPTQTDHLESYQITENSFDLQPSDPTQTVTTNQPREKDALKCAHYFGYVSSGEKIPEECLTCSKLLKCLTSAGGIFEKE